MNQDLNRKLEGDIILMSRKMTLKYKKQEKEPARERPAQERRGQHSRGMHGRGS